MNETIALDWGILMALVLALIYIAAPYIREILGKRTETLGVFGSGLAVGYVFIHLIAEIDSGHELLGNRINLVMLFGFLTYFWVESLYVPNPRANKPEKRKPISIDLRLAFGWLYGWLLLYTLPAAVENKGILFLVPPFLGIGLHLLYESFHQSETNPRRFDTKDRFILASGPVAGWVTDLFFFEDDQMISDVLAAFLAGSVIYKVFSKELPSSGNFRAAWFFGGVMVFTGFDYFGRG